MSDAVWIALIASLPGLIAAVGTFINMMKIGFLHKQVNSRMDQLLETTAKSSKAEGIKEEFNRTRQ